MKKFWNWKSRKIRDQDSGEENVERVLFLNGTIAEESWYDAVSYTHLTLPTIA